jgi:hypothetical protein
VQPFVTGLELSGRFYGEVVAPLVRAHWPTLSYSAALLGAGSEVLGYDTPMSTDHDWGPRVLLFLPEGDPGLAARVVALLREGLPEVYAGWKVPLPVGPEEAGAPARTYVGPLSAFVERLLGVGLERDLAAADWLSIPSQALREMTAGAVFHDGLGTLLPLRERLSYYPRDVWLYMLAAGWQRLGQEEHLMPRAGHAGDEVGSSLIGARLVRDVVSLCFLMERRYAPYAKWFGSAFRGLACAATLEPLLAAALRAERWPEREEALVAAYEHLARQHNALGLTEPLAPEARRFFDRPFRVIDGERFARALSARIVDPAVRALLGAPLVGSVDQWSDSTDLKAPALRRAIRSLYKAAGHTRDT